MSVDSASVANVGKFGAVLFPGEASGHADDVAACIRSGGTGRDFTVLRGVLRAQVEALIAACDEVLWTDYGLQPLRRQDLSDADLADLVRKIGQPEPKQ